MEYGKIIDGVLVTPPTSTIAGIEVKPSREIMLKRGYKEVLDFKPDYNPTTHRIEFESYDDQTDCIYVKYKLIELNPKPTTDERLDIVETGNLEMIDITFDLDFRVFEMECFLEDATGKPVKLNKTNNIEGEDDMKRSQQFRMAEKLILAGHYDRPEMEYKLGRYLKGNRITQEEYDILIALMDADEIVSEVK